MYQCTLSVNTHTHTARKWDLALAAHISHSELRMSGSRRVVAKGCRCGGIAAVDSNLAVGHNISSSSE